MQPFQKKNSKWRRLVHLYPSNKKRSGTWQLVQSSNFGGIPETYIVLLQRWVTGTTASTFHRIFTLSFSDYEEQVIDVNENKYGLNTMLCRRTTLWDGNHASLRMHKQWTPDDMGPINCQRPSLCGSTWNKL